MDVASAGHEMALAICDCIISIPLSRLAIVSEIAAFIFKLILGKLISKQLTGVRYLAAR